MVLPPVIHRDHRLIVLDKPSGLLSVPGIGPRNADNLAGRVQAVLPEARTVHRLDRDTSGVIVMALDTRAHRHLSGQFEHRQTEKIYIAVVHGLLEQDRGEIDLPIRCDIDNRPRQIVDHVQGRSAFTRYEVIERGVDRTRVQLRPVTGRSHQLRVHLRALGHPILGDDLYASPEVRNMAGRLLLHALSLTFSHPETRERVTFVAECPF